MSWLSREVNGLLNTYANLIAQVIVTVKDKKLLHLLTTLKGAVHLSMLLPESANINFSIYLFSLFNSIPVYHPTMNNQLQSPAN